MLCHCCQDLITAEAYHDSEYQVICPLCRPEWSESRSLTISTEQEDTSAHAGAYAGAYQAFLDQQAAMTDFFIKTQTMVWDLAIPHSTYYQAEIKTIAIVEAQFQRVQDLLGQHRRVSTYPVYTFTPPGRIVNNWPDSDDISKQKWIQTVVSDQFWDLVMTSPDALLKNLSWYDLSANPNCDLTIYRQHPDWPWDVKGFNLNPNLSLEWVQSYPELDWDWEFISSSLILSLEWLQALPTKPWDINILVNNARFDISWIAALPYPREQWPWRDITVHYNLVWSWVELYPDSNWDYYRLSDRVPLQYLAEHLDKNWSAYTLAHRPELTLEFLSRMVIAVIAKIPLTPTVRLLTTEEHLLRCIALLHPQLDLAWLRHLISLGLQPIWTDLHQHDNFKWAWVKAFPDEDWQWGSISRKLMLTDLIGGESGADKSFGDIRNQNN